MLRTSVAGSASEPNVSAFLAATIPSQMGQSFRP